MKEKHVISATANAAVKCEIKLFQPLTEIISETRLK